MRLFTVACKANEMKTVLKLLRCFYHTTERRERECRSATPTYTKRLEKAQV